MTSALVDTTADYQEKETVPVVSEKTIKGKWGATGTALLVGDHATDNPRINRGRLD